MNIFLFASWPVFHYMFHQEFDIQLLRTSCKPIVTRILIQKTQDDVYFSSLFNEQSFTTNCSNKHVDHLYRREIAEVTDQKFVMPCQKIFDYSDRSRVVNQIFLIGPYNFQGSSLNTFDCYESQNAEILLERILLNF